MDKSVRDMLDVSRQLKVFELFFEGYTERIEGLLTFSLDDLPRTQVGKIEVHPVECGKKKTVLSLKDEHFAEVAALHQFQSYEDVLEGIPHPYWAIRSALDAVVRYFPDVENDPVVLPPALSQGTCGEAEDLEDWLLVPAICSIAMLKSCDSVATRLAVVVWFQAQLGLDLEERTKAQIAELDWEGISVEI